MININMLQRAPHERFASSIAGIYIALINRSAAAPLSART